MKSTCWLGRDLRNFDYNLNSDKSDSQKIAKQCQLIANPPLARNCRKDNLSFRKNRLKSS